VRELWLMQVHVRYIEISRVHRTLKTALQFAIQSRYILLLLWKNLFVILLGIHASV
jgi:hypothetical protein